MRNMPRNPGSRVSPVVNRVRGGASALVRPALSVLCVALPLGGCATAAAPAPADVPFLEARLQADPGSVGTRLRLAAAYASSGEATRGIPVLEPVLRADPADAVAALYLGLAYEDAGRFADARRLYGTFLDGSTSASVRRQIENRLDLLGRLELREAAVRSLAREEQLTATAPQPQTIGVFPFLVADSALHPLGRALAELMTTDLGQTARLRVLERASIQVLLDEIQLAESGYVDPATAARTGRLVSAAHLVQGRIEGDDADLALQAVVIATSNPDLASEPAREQGAIARLFDMQKQLALAVYSRLGIQLTAAERQRVERRATQNVQALLAFGFGLEAMDGGRFAEAAVQFARAEQLDPGFIEAGELRAESEREAAAAAITTLQIARLASTEIDLGLSPWQRRQLGLDALELLIPLPQVRQPAVEVLGTEGLNRGPVIDIIIRRPGGSL